MFCIEIKKSFPQWFSKMRPQQLFITKTNLIFEQQFIIKYLALFLSIIGLTIIGFCLYLYPHHYNLTGIRDLIIPGYQVVLNPSLKEHFIFTRLLLFTPILVFGVVLLSRYLNHRYRLPDKFYFYWQIIFVFSLVSFFYIFVHDFFEVFSFRLSYDKLLIAFLPFFLIILPKKNFNISTCVSLTILIIAGLFQALSYRIFTLSSVSDNSMWSIHFDAFFYSIVQAVAGKAALTDFHSQYGLYAELLKPLFKIIPLTVFNITTFLSILEILALLSIAKILIRFIQNHLLILISFIGIIFLTGMNWNLLEFYYQYWPLRFFFPAISLIFFLRLLDNFTPKNIILLSIISSVAVIWNIDSGISVLGSYLIFLTAQIIFPSKPNLRIFYFKALLLSLIISTITFLAFFSYLELKTPKPLHWDLVFIFQKVFYLSGFMKIDLPLYFGIPAWTIVAGIYLFGFIQTFNAWLNHRHFKVDSLIFYLSIMGCGLFCYYQGRSHPINLAAVLWPALVISLILTDKLLRAIKLRKLSLAWSVAALPAIFFVSYLAIQFISDIPMMTHLLKINWKLNLVTKPTPIMENIQFINSQVKDRNSVVILTRNQSVYYSGAGLASAIESPGLVQTLTVPEFNHLLSQLSDHPVKHLFISPFIYSSDNNVPELLGSLLKYYQIKKHYHDIYYLEPF